MGILLAFAAGYILGAKAGSDDFDDVIDAVNAIRQSEEFNDLVRSLRSHAAHTLRELASLVERPGATTSLASVTTEDLVERVKNLVGRV